MRAGPAFQILVPPEKIELSDGSVALVVPIRLTRRCGRRLVQMQVAPEASRPSDRQKTPLLVALMRAHRWLALLEEGEVASLSDIARLEKTDVSYVARTLNLTSLAPEIIEAILDENLPNAISLNDLTINPATSWIDQAHQNKGGACRSKSAGSKPERRIPRLDSIIDRQGDSDATLAAARRVIDLAYRTRSPSQA